ncbi:MAG: S8 family serine peptidase [Gammaproteobacteria bacterium]|nr:S8 family serine peptidase [Gammaproteobacteria bacterium]
MSLKQIVACLALSLAALSTAGIASATEAVVARPGADKPVIARKDDLPRHTYRLDLKVTDLYLPRNRPALLKLAQAVQADILRDLATYDIRDDTTVRDYYAVLGSIALLEMRWQDCLDLLAKQRALETKEANRLTMGLYSEALAKARLSGGDTDKALKQNLEQALQALDYAVVQDNLKSARGRTEILSRAFVLGNLESSYQPIVDRTSGEISYDIASSLVSAGVTLDYFLPDAPVVNELYSAKIAANTASKKDIWKDRQFVLDATAKASPVVVAIWDSGVDTAIDAFVPLLWSNVREIPGNGIDDDTNGFVDDIHGIAYDLHSNKERSLLYPIGEFKGDPALMQSDMKGLGDIQSGVDSAEASALRKRLAALDQDQVKDFLESLDMYGNYAHGTHVAGIAVEGNPFIRLLVARITYSHTVIPEEPTLELARAEAKSIRETVDYFKASGVRAVNMSWGGSLRSIEEALEAHNAGGSPEERRKLAREIFTIGDTALRESIRDAKDILFITSAGNSDNDVKFDEFYPSGYDYPNMLSVGAVDAAGDETSFTSLGKVDIYANGFEVESYVPGGNRIKFNGTSMSSPQVLNLAAKLLALDPALGTAQLRRLILDGSDAKVLATRTIKLLNPAASAALIR